MNRDLWFVVCDSLSGSLFLAPLFYLSFPQNTATQHWTREIEKRGPKLMMSYSWKLCYSGFKPTASKHSSSTLDRKTQHNDTAHSHTTIHILGVYEWLGCG